MVVLETVTVLFDLQIFEQYLTMNFIYKKCDYWFINIPAQSTGSC